MQLFNEPILVPDNVIFKHPYSKKEYQGCYIFVGYDYITLSNIANDPHKLVYNHHIDEKIMLNNVFAYHAGN
jgi:hypothetical protein